MGNIKASKKDKSADSMIIFVIVVSVLMMWLAYTLLS
jgi:hypothetical protein